MPLYADALPPTIRARPDRAEYKWWHLADYVTCIRPESARKTARNPGENKGLQWSIKLEARVAEIHGNWRRDVRKESSKFAFRRFEVRSMTTPPPLGGGVYCAPKIGPPK